MDEGETWGWSGTIINIKLMNEIDNMETLTIWMKLYMWMNEKMILTKSFTKVP
jgi:hypothetical protein